jgi:hypothetical protein
VNTKGFVKQAHMCVSERESLAASFGENFLIRNNAVIRIPDLTFPILCEEYIWSSRKQKLIKIDVSLPSRNTA